MIKFTHFLLAMAIVSVAFIAGCVREGSGDLYDRSSKEFYPNTPHLQEIVQKAFVEARAGDRFIFKKGTFVFNNTLSLDGKEGIIIEGQGMNETILSFDGQLSGAEGLKITNGTDLVLARLTVKDTKGDAVKVKDVNGITFYEVGVDWTGEPETTNGAYGLYPVTCQNVLIDKCYVRGASDAGIYVGQSSNCIVRNSLVEYNVAGIEIENTSNSDIYGNTARYNTGGILVFDLPEIPVKNGVNNRVYNNNVHENHYQNFANPAGMVANVPPGTGILLMSAQEVEVYNNQIILNNVLGLGVMSYQTLVALDPDQSYNDPEYDPFTHGIYAHDNVFGRNQVIPPYQHNITDVITGFFTGGNVPDILYDGYVYPSTNDNDRICLKNNGSANFGNLDVPNTFANINTNITPFDCTHAALPAPTVNAPVYP
jgi:parallel beta-helix repeat protein